MNSNQEPSPLSPHLKKMRALFCRIANHYEQTNDLISLGLNRYWLNSFIKKITSRPSHQALQVVDLCGGSGAVSLALSKKSKLDSLCVVDISPTMLSIAENNLKGSHFKMKFLCEDACKTSLNNSEADLVTIAYGLRNIEDRSLILQEAYRLLKDSGEIWILELTKPKNFFLAWGHRLYLDFILPLLARISTSDRAAYAYLRQSVKDFVEPEVVLKEMRNAHFQEVSTKSMTLGSIHLFHGVKRSHNNKAS